MPQWQIAADLITSAEATLYVPKPSSGSLDPPGSRMLVGGFSAIVDGTACRRAALSALLCSLQQYC